MVDMVENIMEAARTVTRTADIVKDYEVPAGAVQQRAGPAPARGRARPSPPPRPGLARPQGPDHRVDGGAGVRAPACGRPSGPGPGGWTSRPSTSSTTTGGSRPPRPGPTLTTPPWRWSGSRTAKTACATGRATWPASPDRTEGEGEPPGITDRSRWLPRPGGR